MTDEHELAGDSCSGAEVPRSGCEARIWKIVRHAELLPWPRTRRAHQTHPICAPKAVRPTLWVPMTAVDQVTIRVATLADARDLAGMHVASWHEAYAGILPAEMLASLSVDGRAAMWAQIMGEPATSGSTVVYVAELENRIVGFGSCGAQRTESLKGRAYDGGALAQPVCGSYETMLRRVDFTNATVLR
jgi:hypothetical protein